MSSGSSWNKFFDRAWDLQATIEARGRRWIRKMGPGFLVGLVGFSLIACGFFGVVYYQTCDRGIVYLIKGDKDGDTDVPTYVNPIMILLYGFIVVFLVLLKKWSELTRK
jgi:hypothetical protein